MTRACALTGIGLFGTVGRALRLPAGPLGNDEFIHMRQTLETYLTGQVGHASQLLGISEHFPGLHQAISAFARLTGSPLWPAALTVIFLAHVLSVLAVYQLVRAVGASARGAAVGAVVYTLDPSWASFDVTVSYESLALPMLLWGLAATVAASRTPERPSLRYIAVVAAVYGGIADDHHLSTIMLCLILALLIVAGLVHIVRRLAGKDRGAPRERLWPLLLAAYCLSASMIFWWSEFWEKSPNLGPSLVNGWRQLKNLGDLAPSMESGIRVPFAGHKTRCTRRLRFAVSLRRSDAGPRVLAVLWRNRRRLGSAPWGFAALGAMFFLSLPMVLTSGGAEGAHRSWAFTFIGIAVLCGLAWSFGMSPAVFARFGWLGRCAAYLERPRVRIGVVGVVLTVMYLGCAALGTNISARFPGSAHVGDDARSVSGRALLSPPGWRSTPR